jgi:hypothetical protein
VYFTENVFDNLASASYPGIARGVAIYGVVSPVIERTVITGTLSSIMFLEQVTRNCVFRDNVMVTGRYGVVGTGHGTMGALTNYCPGFTWANMTFIGGTASGYPAGSRWIATESGSSLAAQVRAAVAAATKGVIVR